MRTEFSLLDHHIVAVNPFTFHLRSWHGTVDWWKSHVFPPRWVGMKARMQMDCGELS